MSETRNIFISHVHGDDDLLPKLKELLARQDVEIRDGSINASKPNEATNEQYIKDKYLKPRIDWASVLVVLITHDTANSWWVNWEIEQANKLGKRIVGVYERGGTEADKPAALEKYASAIVGWNSDSIMSAIDGKDNPFQNPDGSTRDGTHATVCVTC